MDRRSFLKTLAMVGVAPLMVPARAQAVKTMTFTIEHGANSMINTWNAFDDIEYQWMTYAGTLKMPTVLG